jgi:hypothetical protein
VCARSSIRSVANGPAAIYSVKARDNDETFIDSKSNPTTTRDMRLAEPLVITPCWHCGEGYFSRQTAGDGSKMIGSEKM